MPRYKLLIEYDGSGFVGWQRQKNGLSVQHVVETALAKLYGTPVILYAAGRTDAGVHATGQVAHFDGPRAYAADKVRDALNHFMKPSAVAILSAEQVDDQFHARFSAIGRAYLFRILNRKSPPTLDQTRVWWVPVPLDAAAMQAGAQFLVGHNDFTSFRATECQAKSPMKTLDVLDVVRVGDEIHITAAARSFLHHQVRNMVGTLKLVGMGSWTPRDVKTALDAKLRAAGGPTSPPDGLYLTGVRY